MAEVAPAFDIELDGGERPRGTSVKPAVRELLRRDDALDRIGAERVHGDVDLAVTAQMIAADTPESDLGKNPP